MQHIMILFRFAPDGQRPDMPTGEQLDEWLRDAGVEQFAAGCGAKVEWVTCDYGETRPNWPA